MPGVSVRCTGCGAGLKAPAGKPKVRCPQCGAVIRVPQATDEPEVESPPLAAPQRRAGPGLHGEAREEEELDELEEVDEGPSRARARDDEGEDRWRRRKRHLRGKRGDGPWLVAVGAAAACFFGGFGVTLIAFGTKGLPENQQEGGVLVKLAALAFGVLVALVLVVMGSISVKNRRISDRWGNVTKGPVAVVLGMVVTVLGGALGGFVVYGLLLGLIRGR